MLIDSKAPLILAFVLGPILENSMRQSLKLSGGDFTIFVSRPISVALLSLAVLVLLSNLFFQRGRDALDAEDAKV